jgi:hypothetical protein
MSRVCEIDVCGIEYTIYFKGWGFGLNELKNGGIKFGDCNNGGFYNRTHPCNYLTLVQQMGCIALQTPGD